MSMMAKLCASVWALLLYREPEPRSRKDLHVVAELGTGCERMHVLLTPVVQKHWEWERAATRGCRGSWEHMPLFAASLNVNTAFGVAKLNVMANVLEESRLHRGLISAFQKVIRNLPGLADFFYCVKCLSEMALAAFLMVPLGETWKGQLEDEK